MASGSSHLPIRLPRLSRAALGCIVLALMLLAVAAMSGRRHQSPFGVSLGSTLSVQCARGRFYFHNLHGHYQGSILNLAPAPQPQVVGLDWPGLYFRHIRAVGSPDWWTLGLAVWWPVLTLLLLAAACQMIHWRRRRMSADVRHHAATRSAAEISADATDDFAN